MHPRFNELRADNSRAGLQLAAIHAATASLLPYPSNKTGVEVAMELIERSWANRPLSEAEHDSVHNILEFCGHAPGLAIRCHELLISSQQLSFLHGIDQQKLARKPRKPLGMAVAEYMEEARLSYRNPRRLLTATEELRVLGEHSSPAWASVARAQRRHESDELLLAELAPCPWPASYVMQQEDVLKGLLDTHLLGSLPSSNARPPSQDVAWPLAGPMFEDGALGTIGCLVKEELWASWEKHRRSLTVAATTSEPAKHFFSFASGVLEARLSDVSHRRQDVEEYLLHALQQCEFKKMYAAGQYERTTFFILRAAELIPTPTTADLAKIAIGSEDIRTFNPNLSQASQARFLDANLLWLQLCVLEDRHRRLLMHAKRENAPMLFQELGERRSWDVAAHPKWLVFEVEGGLQIRPVQYETAQKMMDHPASLVQLNMGQGKTRVIVPMLVLEWADGSNLVRVHALSSIIGELQDFLQAHLTNSILSVKVFLQPFHRDVNLDADRVSAMHASLEYCRRAGGLLLVAPEHRLSLKLKGQELHAQGETEICAFLNHLASMPTIDLLDESDEILHHRYQLIYACGSPIDLPNGVERSQIVQAVLMVIKTDKEVVTLLQDVSVRDHEAFSEAFTPCRLMGGTELDDCKDAIFEAILDSLLSNPPFESSWLKNYTTHKDTLYPLIMQKDKELTLPEWVPPDHRVVFLMLRGLLACGVLVHTMSKRYAVEYGINEKGKKRLAVPYRASQTPSERSEYGHPDAAITLTILSYYHRGLTEPEFSQALKIVLAYDRAAQNFYSGWLELSLPRMKLDGANWSSVERANQIDMTNLSQQLLYVPQTLS
jgi:hypothetical protein